MILALLLAALLGRLVVAPLLDLGVRLARLGQPPRPIFRRRQLARLDPTLRRRRVLLDLRSLRTVATDARCNSARRPALLNERPLASDCSFMPSTASVLTSTEPEAISPVSDCDRSSSSVAPASFRKSDSVW